MNFLDKVKKEYKNVFNIFLMVGLFIIYIITETYYLIPFAILLPLIAVLLDTNFSLKYRLFELSIIMIGIYCLIIQYFITAILCLVFLPIAWIGTNNKRNKENIEISIDIGIKKVKEKKEE